MQLFIFFNMIFLADNVKGSRFNVELRNLSSFLNIIKPDVFISTVIEINTELQRTVEFKNIAETQNITEICENGYKLIYKLLNMAQNDYFNENVAIHDIRKHFSHYYLFPMKDYNALIDQNTDHQCRFNQLDRNKYAFVSIMLNYYSVVAFLASDFINKINYSDYTLITKKSAYLVYMNLLIDHILINYIRLRDDTIDYIDLNVFSYNTQTHNIFYLIALDDKFIDLFTSIFNMNSGFMYHEKVGMNYYLECVFRIKRRIGELSNQNSNCICNIFNNCNKFANNTKRYKVEYIIRQVNSYAHLNIKQNNDLLRSNIIKSICLGVKFKKDEQDQTNIYVRGNYSFLDENEKLPDFIMNIANKYLEKFKINQKQHQRLADQLQPSTRYHQPMHHELFVPPISHQPPTSSQFTHFDMSHYQDRQLSDINDPSEVVDCELGEASGYSNVSTQNVDHFNIQNSPLNLTLPRSVENPLVLERSSYEIDEDKPLDLSFSADDDIIDVVD